MNIIYKGLFLTKESEEVLLHHSEPLNLLVKNMHITFEFKPLKPFPLHVLGKMFKLKIIGEGNDGINHGFLVELPDELKELYFGSENVHITVSLRDKEANPKETGDLVFKPITPIEIEGKMGHYIDKKVLFR